MITELQESYQNIMGSLCSEDVFGTIRGETADAKLSALKELFIKISEVVNPEHYPDNLDNKEMAYEAFKRLEEFYERAQEKIRLGTYGQHLDDHIGSTVIKTGKHSYYVDSVLAEGDISTVYRGGCLGGDDFAGQVAIKIVEDPADNDLMQNEIRVLKRLQSEPGAQSKHLPVFLDQFRTTEGQTGIVTRFIEGYNLLEVRKSRYHKNGVDQKHAIWMLNRLLSATGFFHDKGTVHCNIEPSNILIRPKDHNLWIIGWGGAAINPFQTGDGFKVHNEDYSAPEVAEKKTPTPSADLYSIGKVMIYILGGNIKTNSIPAKVDERFQRFIKYFVFESPIQRPRDAWEMHEKLIQLRDEMWPRKFLEFKM